MGKVIRAPPPALIIEVMVSCSVGRCLGGEQGQRKQKNKSVGEKRNVMCIRETAQLMVPVRTVPTIRCSAKAEYCARERWVRENQCVQRGRQEGHARSEGGL